MKGTVRAAADMQGYVRSYVRPETPWDRITSGHPGSALLLRLLPFLLLGVTLPIALVTPVMVPYANYALVLLPAFTALVNGPIATATATLVVAALVSAGSGALGFLPYPESGWSDLAPIAFVGLLCTALAWIRNRIVMRLLDMTLVAETVQGAILPDLPERIGGARVAVAYRTAEGSPGLVGGDFYDVQDTEFGVRAVVGDVQGHDLATVHLTDSLLGTFRERALDDPDLATLAARMERRVRLHNRRHDEWSQTFATAALIEMTPGLDTVRVVLCGHPAPLLVRGSATPLSARPMPPLGLADFAVHRTEIREATLMPGDLVVAYSDGIAEARNAEGRTFPLIARVDAHVASGVRDPEQLHRKLKADFQGGGFVRTDDLTVLIIQVPRATGA
ncbi:serine/threonine-protein phosphatase [Glycomyces sp. TRM65418]|uniref:PP2C family protein-serine/threonine phosphatase n=1 Tax=Glycomyces sp. TRM65418 TaxID=2867006 RepID=UPI001CE66BA1|nr:PP2C family protein-serine/threonine phosphatase [Glycomyces sp. TRM65418]MCC3763120.1 serine/threonine-protein phosphatase [Glycomyces sp. TRM65418]QZD57128.1 serine/threonine-protein phosphatase [Glycomyces sp. TRM65418]